MIEPWWVVQRHPVVERVRQLVEPLLEAEGFELVDVEYRPGARAQLRLFIDVLRPEGDVALEAGAKGGITLEQLTRLNRLLSDALDVEEPITHAYTLEVSSPGLDRALTRRRHFQAAVGQALHVRTHHKHDGRQNFRGVLRGVAESTIELELETGAVAIPVEAIAKARLEYRLDAAQGRLRSKGQ